MEFLNRLLKPSRKITSVLEQNRAKLLTILLLGRAIALASVVIIIRDADFTGLQAATQALWFALTINILAYVLSRTTYYRVAACLIILETIIGTPVVVYRMPTLDVIAAAPYWMTFGTLLSSLVLPVRYTIAFTFLSILGFLAMSFVVPEDNLPSLAASLVFFGLCSLLAAFGTAMRDNPKSL